MANNKKSKTVKTKPAAVEVPAPVAGPRSKRLFTSAQFSGLVFLCVGISYLLEFRSVLESEKCQEYLQDYDDGECTGADMIMIRVKYHSGILAEALVALCVFLCWNDEALFHRLNAMLVSSPLITTLLALQTTKGMVHAGHSFKLCMLVTVLLMVAASSIYAANTRIASRVPVTMDLQNATLLTIAVAYAWEVYKFLSAGVGGFLQVSEVSQPSIALLPFLAVDQCTIVGICFFGIAFLNNDKKRTLLIFIAMCQFAARFLQFPLIRDSLLDESYYDNFLFGTAMFSLTASFAPEVTFFKEPTAQAAVTEEEETKED